MDQPADNENIWFAPSRITCGGPDTGLKLDQMNITSYIILWTIYLCTLDTSKYIICNLLWFLDSSFPSWDVHEWWFKFWTPCHQKRKSKIASLIDPAIALPQSFQVQVFMNDFSSFVSHSQATSIPRICPFWLATAACRQKKHKFATKIAPRQSTFAFSKSRSIEYPEEDM